MTLILDDTIAALASAPGPAARGIIRVSGPDAISCVQSIFQPEDELRWRRDEATSAHQGSVRIPLVRSPLHALVYRWPQGRSYTGQALIEIHAPGSPPLLEAVLSCLYERGCRPAAAGEFTL